MSSVQIELYREQEFHRGPGPACGLKKRAFIMQQLFKQCEMLGKGSLAANTTQAGSNAGSMTDGCQFDNKGDGTLVVFLTGSWQHDAQSANRAVKSAA